MVEGWDRESVGSGMRLRSASCCREMMIADAETLWQDV